MSHTILLVEDNEDNVTVYRTILEHSGFRVLEARDGLEGIQAVRESLPDLVLMDISIPHVNGWDATRILKADPATAGVPIVALTAHAFETDRALAVEVGCAGYLVKPIEPRQVVAEVRRLLGVEVE